MEEEGEGEEIYEQYYDEIAPHEETNLTGDASEPGTAAAAEEAKVPYKETTTGTSETTSDKKTILFKLKKKFRSRKSCEDLTSHCANRESETLPVNHIDDGEARRRAFQRRTISLPPPNTPIASSSVAEAYYDEPTCATSSKRPRSKTFTSGFFNRLKGRRSEEDKLSSEGQDGSGVEQTRNSWAYDEFLEKNLLPGQCAPPPLPERRREERESADSTATSESSHNSVEPQVSQEASYVKHDESPSDELPDQWKVTLTDGLQTLSTCSWYWGPLTRFEAEEKLNGKPDGAFLVRDSSDECHLLSMSFRTNGQTFHTRISHDNGRFGFLTPAGIQGSATIVELIERSMKISKRGALCFSRGSFFRFSIPVRFITPVSRFDGLPSLQHLCRFVIRQNMRCDQINELPLPTRIIDYLKGNHFLEDE